MAIGRFLAPLNGQMLIQNTEKPYVDDIFDPLFNRQVLNYNTNLYGNRLIGTMSGYADMFENALTGTGGILGPGMGILGTFGRSMDKADDFILGGLTEGINRIGHNVLGGTNEAPSSPFERIFVDDYDYEGTGLMAAAANSMAKLAGVTEPLTNEDFSSLGDRAAGAVLNIATDPGFIGSRLSKLPANTPVGNLGKILDTYDNTMATAAGNLAFPGGKALLQKTFNRISDALGADTSKSPINVYTKTKQSSANI